MEIARPLLIFTLPMKPTLINLDEIYFDVERTEDEKIFSVENIAIWLNEQDDQYYLKFDINPPYICGVSIPLSYLKQSESSFRSDRSDTRYAEQLKYSETFHEDVDYSAAKFQALGTQYRMYDVFSISLYVHEKLVEAQNQFGAWGGIKPV